MVQAIRQNEDVWPVLHRNCYDRQATKAAAAQLLAQYLLRCGFPVPTQCLCVSRAAPQLL